MSLEHRSENNFGLGLYFLKADCYNTGGASGLVSGTARPR